MTNHADVKELIPEFYNPTGGFDFLINARSLQLGATQTGDRVNDVDLPPWAKSPRDFLRKMRKALESDYCTRQLPHWIGLVFGVNSRGENAKETFNLFHPNAYLGPSDLEAMDTEQDKFQAELQAVEFGIIPDQLFSGVHPPKKGHSVIGTAATSPTTTDAGDTDFVSETIGKAPVGGEGDGLDDTELKPGEQAWELLDSPVMRHESDSNGNGAGADDTSPTNEPSEIGSSPVTSFRRAKESWGPIQASSTDSFDHHVTTMSPTGASGTHLHGRSKDPSGKLLTAEQQYTSKSTTVASTVDAGAAVISRNLALSGSGEMSLPGQDNNFHKKNSQYENMDGFADATEKQHRAQSIRAQSQPGTRSPHGVPATSNVQSSATTTGRVVQAIPVAVGWDMKVLEKAKIHNDAVSGCSFVFPTNQTGSGGMGMGGNAFHRTGHYSQQQQQQQQQDMLVTVSLDGSLIVHTLDLFEQPAPYGEEPERGMLAGTLSRFSYMGLGQTRQAPKSKLTQYRKHGAADPLACLSITDDGGNGQVVFAGGHDDRVLAYGINSTCAVASVYSHRDAVTGIQIIQRHPLLTGNALWTDITTHLMVSGSWDATVKVWSVAVASGETVSINREPLAELFDADSTIVSLAASYLINTGLVIAAGCSDGSLVVWMCHGDGSESFE